MKIGKIISVEFDKFRVKLFHTTKNSTVSIEGVVYYFGNIGSYLKVQNATSDYIICEVVAVLDNTVEGKIYSSFNLDSSRELVIKPVGTLKSNDEFEMGVGIFPSIYSDVWIVTNQDLEKILNPVKGKVPDNKIESKEEKGKVHSEITIGHSKSMINYKIDLNINKLFNIHTAVLGNSGSGKSNTIAHIFQEVFRKRNYEAIGAKVILFDVNGEYKRAFEKENRPDIDIKFYKPNFNNDGYERFVLPYYLMNLDEWTAFLMASDRTQKPFWDKVLQECYKFYKIKTAPSKEKGKFINYFRYKLNNIINSILTRVDSDTANITSAGSALRRIKDILSSDNFKNIDETAEFLEDIKSLLSQCTINFGRNDDKLLGRVNAIESKTDIESALLIYEDKLRHGDFYDFEFLKIAADLVLLEEESKGNTRIREFTSTMIARLDYFLYNPDCLFMRSSSNNYATSEEEYLALEFGIKRGNCKSQLIIIDSSEISGDILELMTSVIGRIIFDYRKKLKGEERIKEPIHLILDEAHRYIRKNAEYILRENIFEKIAREGRKYSYYLMVSSQRPSELSETVLSQCGNFIIHRIQNEVDMKYIYSVLPYFSPDYINKIKQSVPGEALIFGNCVPMPLHVKVIQAKPDPNSENCRINEEWYKEKEV